MPEHAPSSRSRLERAVDLGLVLLLVGVGLGSYDRAVRGRYDFHHFYRDARYVWEHRALNPEVLAFAAEEHARQLPFYLPVVPVILAPLAGFGRLVDGPESAAPRAAALVWAALQVAALGYALRVLRRWSTPAEGPVAAGVQADRPTVFAVAVILTLPAIFEAVRFNQLSFFVLALVLGSVDRLARGRDVSGGMLLALAAVLKLLPAIFLPWLLLTRRWRAAGAFAVTGLLIAFVPPAVVFGPAQALAYHAEWWSRNAGGRAAGPGGGLLEMAAPDHFIDHRNQSIVQVLARWTWPEHRFPAPWQPVALSASAVQVLALGVMVVLALVLLWVTASKRTQSIAAGRAEAAVYAIGMLVFSPLLRQYYLVWTLPALLLLVGLAAQPRGVRGRGLGVIGVAVWVAGMALWTWPAARLLGVHLAMLLILGGLLLAARGRGQSVRAEQEEAGAVAEAARREPGRSA
ncbi:MAG: glycosyltransferase family 87 protein [Planctomycetota bacterium]